MTLDTALARYRDLLVENGRLGFTWFGSPDSRWEHVWEALGADLPTGERPSRAFGQGPFGSVAAMHDHLAAQGWTQVSTETILLDVRVQDADHWFEWSWSQGYRAVLEKLEARGMLGAARNRVGPLLEEMKRDGGLVRRAKVRATLASP